MATDLYVDGIGKIVFANGAFRVELVTLDTAAVAGADPAMVCQRLVVTPDGLRQMAARLASALRQAEGRPAGDVAAPAKSPNFAE